eukprot:4632423-Amphidinium_carterae.1
MSRWTPLRQYTSIIVLTVGVCPKKLPTRTQRGLEFCTQVCAHVQARYYALHAAAGIGSIGEAGGKSLQRPQ